MRGDIVKLAERHGVAHLPIEQLFAFYQEAFNAGEESLRQQLAAFERADEEHDRIARDAAEARRQLAECHFKREEAAEQFSKAYGLLIAERDECLQTIARLDEANLCMHTELATVTAERDELAMILKWVDKYVSCAISPEIKLALAKAERREAGQLGADKTGD